MQRKALKSHKEKSKTDWKQLAEMNDEALDTSDIAELDGEYFQKAELRVPAKQSATLRIDQDGLLQGSEKGESGHNQ